MIGQLINEFDALPEDECNLATFNEMFKVDIRGPQDSIVEIGEPLLGSLRSVTVGSTELKVAFRDIKPSLNGASKYILEFKYELFDNGVLLHTYDEKAKVAKFLGKSDTLVTYMIEKESVCEGRYTLKATQTGKRLKKFLQKKVKEFKKPDSSRKFGKNYYIIEKNGIEICCNSVSDCASIIKASPKKFQNTYKSEGRVNGYLTTKHKMTEEQFDIKASYRKANNDNKIEVTKQSATKGKYSISNKHKGARAKYTWSIKIDASNIKLFKTTREVAEFLDKSRESVTMSFKKDCTKKISGYFVTRLTNVKD